MKRFSILVDFNQASQTTRFQLRSDQGCRPGTRTATPSRPRRVYVEYFTAKQILRGAKKFDMLREELEREVN